MKVRNREGQDVAISYDEIKRRITCLCTDEEIASIDIDVVVFQTIHGIYDGITTGELDDLSARVCATMQSVHYLYDVVAAKIALSNMAKSVRRRLLTAGFGASSFSTKMAYIASSNLDAMDEKFVLFVGRNGEALDAMIDYKRDAHHSFFAVRTMERSYLLKVDDLCIESPQDMWMRVAVAVNIGEGGVGGDDSDADALNRIRECYDLMSNGYFTHATPTLFNAGMRHQQCSSCYLMGTDDSLSGIFETISDAAQISKWAGGIGVHVSNIRAKGTKIRSTNGTSDGIIPMLKVYNEMVRYCNQAGRRKGSLAAYLEPWHADVWEFVELRRSTGAETERARDIFLGLWVPDEFMHRLEEDKDWYLMSPDECAGLVDAVGSDFTELYERYIAEGKYVRVVKARALWQYIINCQLETGTPYILYKDHVNRKNNQSNVGTIRSSNLCVAPETSVLTRDGYRVISTLVDEQVEVWNGKRWSEVTVCRTGIQQPLLRVTFDNGETIDCTPYHKFYVCHAEGFLTSEVQAKDLVPGSKVEPFSFPNEPHVKKSTEGSNEGSTKRSAERSAERRALVWRLCRKKRRSEWLEFKRVLNMQGVGGRVVRAGGAQEDEYYALELTDAELDFLTSTGAYDNGEIVEVGPAVSIGVVSVEDVGRRDDTYCFEEPLEHRAVFNGVLTGQCAEIVQYSDSDNYAVCNLASIAVNRFLKADGTPEVDHIKLHAVTKRVTRNLDRIISINMYPTPECRRSNEMMRPIGIGIQGMGDLYCMLNLPYDDPRALKLDEEIMETIYHGAMEATVELAAESESYSRFEGSPLSRGVFQFDMWGATPTSGRYDWSAMRERVVAVGARNSMLVALMPTASTSQILGNCESFEPFQSNLYKRSTLAGEFLVVNRHLQRELMKRGLWNEAVRKQLMVRDGSVQDIELVPQDLKNVYKTVWEVTLRSIVDHAVARGPFVCQSQSMNLYMATPSFHKLSSALLYGWRKGLKTGMYYLRSSAAVEAIKYGVASSSAKPAAITNNGGCGGTHGNLGGTHDGTPGGSNIGGGTHGAMDRTTEGTTDKKDVPEEERGYCTRRGDPGCTSCGA